MKKLLLVLCLIAGGLFGPNAKAALVNSVSDGPWSQGSTWSTGTVPGAGDEIHVYHNVSLNTSITINNLLYVEEGASLKKATNSQDIIIGATGVAHFRHNASCRNLQVYGTIHIYNDVLVKDSLVVDNNVDLFNGSTVNIYGLLHCANFTSLAGSETYVYAPVGTLVCTSKLDNGGLIDNDWVVSVEGNLVNNSGQMTGNGGNYYCDPTFTNNASATVDCNGTPINICRPDGSYPVVNGSGYVNVACVLLCNGPWPTPQPVQIQSFDGHQVGKGIRLNWITSAEEGFSEFLVERASFALQETCTLDVCGGSLDFKQIGRVTAQGANGLGSAYMFEDPTPASGVNWYRLRLMDKGGSYAFSKTIEVAYLPGAATLTVWPNPTQSAMTVRLTGKPGEIGKVRLFSIDGRLVWEQSITLDEGEKRLELQTCDYAAGIYLLEFTQASSKATQKIVFTK